MTAEQLAILEAQRAYFASDQRLRDVIAASDDETPSERLDAVAAACRDAMSVFAAIDPILQDRALAAARFPADTLVLLAALRAGAR